MNARAAERGSFENNSFEDQGWEGASMSALRSAVASVLAGVLVLACASGGAPQGRTKGPPTGQPLSSTGDRVGKVVVTPDEGLTAEQKQAIASYKVAESLGAQIAQRA